MKTQRQIAIDNMTLLELVKHIDTYGYECQGGPLASAYAWQTLKRKLRIRELTQRNDEGGAMLDAVRQSLKARADGIEAGGDIEVMQAVDRIVERERGK